jgi:hypothetical protein
LVLNIKSFLPKPNYRSPLFCGELCLKENTPLTLKGSGFLFNFYRGVHLSAIFILMNKNDIIARLRSNHLSFTSLILSLNEQQFLFTINNKWTAGQQAEHILRSVKPVNLAFGLPHFFLRIMFGKSNRPSKSFDGLVQKYNDKLAAGGKASARYIPNAVVFTEREKTCASILKVNDALCKKLNRCSETELDGYILPHPLLGKLTLREMLYFNIHHVKHHEMTVGELVSGACRHRG